LNDPGAAGCHRSYPTLCLPERDRDWNCADFREREFPVLPPDPYKLDADEDGVGCE
jgi:micrococcal nuclease